MRTYNKVISPDKRSGNILITFWTTARTYNYISS